MDEIELRLERLEGAAEARHAATVLALNALFSAVLASDPATAQRVIERFEQSALDSPVLGAEIESVPMAVGWRTLAAIAEASASKGSS